MIRLLCFAAFLLSVTPTPRATAQGATFRYRVQPGDTCAGIARRLYGSSRDYERIHELWKSGGLPDLRTAAYAFAIKRVGEAYLEAGIYP